MTNKKPRKRAEPASQEAPELNPFPGITGPGAEPHTSPGEPSKGVFGDGMDGTLGDVSERQREQLGRERAAGERERHDQHNMTSGTSISPLSGSFDTPPERAGGMGTGTGRGRGSSIGGGVAGSGDSAGTGASSGLGSDLGGGLTGGTSGPARPGRSDSGATGGGVAVSQGRGSDIGAFKRGMARDPGVEPISGGGSGGSRADDLGMGEGADLDAQPNDRQGLSADERATGDRGRDTP